MMTVQETFIRAFLGAMFGGILAAFVILNIWNYESHAQNIVTYEGQIPAGFVVELKDGVLRVATSPDSNVIGVSLGYGDNLTSIAVVGQVQVYPREIGEIGQRVVNSKGKALPIGDDEDGDVIGVQISEYDYTTGLIWIELSLWGETIPLPLG